MISAGSKVCGVMAWPVEHSLSPCMQNYFAEKTGIDLAYVPLKVAPENLEEAVKGAYALHFTGVNVTVPHKQAIMEFLAEIDEDARAIGAVNTLVRTDHGFKGYNTDADGLLRAMEGQGIAIKGRQCLLLGAGGAAKAAAYLLAREGAGKVWLLNRNQDRAQELAGYINGLFGRELMVPMALESYEDLPDGPFLTIQTTSVGMYPHTDHAVIEDREFYKKIDVAVDIVYNPFRTAFMRMVEEAGGQAVNGLDMLIYQGMTAYERWNPEAVFTPDMVTGARELMKRRLEAGR